MKILRQTIILILSLAITTSCDKANVLTEYSKTDTDEALFIDSLKKMDNLDWDGAIDILTNQLSTDYRARRDVKERLMQAYGGKCGISFFDLIANLKGVSSSKMFEFSLQIFGNRSVNVAACDNSFNVLMNLGTSGVSRTNDENLFAAVLGLTKMATNLHVKLDTENAGLGNGTVDAGWDSCNSGAAVGLTDAQVDKVISGVGLIFENLAVLGAQLTSGSAGTSLTNALNQCESYLGAGNCTIVQESAVTPQIRRLFRRMMSSSAMGFGACDLNDMMTPSCCPGIANP